MKEEKDFTVENEKRVLCNVCKQWYDNWVGSTPCCGSIAFQVNKETGEVSKDFFMHVQIGE